MSHLFLFLQLALLIGLGQPRFLWVIDTDAGGDDGVAILLALGWEALHNDTKIIGLTAVAGNTNVDNVGRNLLKILKTAQRLDIPVYKGANGSLVFTPAGDNFFGEDGFGDFDFPDPPSEDLIQKVHAVNFLTQVVKDNPGQVNLLSIGPMTNLALAIRMDPSFFGNLGGVWSLSSSINAYGNVKPGVEFNIFADADAASVVYDEASRVRKRISMFPWESALRVNISVDWRLNVFGKLNSPLVDLLNKAEAISIPKEDSWISGDTFATALTLVPALSSGHLEHFGRVETCGAYGRGLTILDYNGIEEKWPQLRVVKPGSFNTSGFQEILIETFRDFTSILGNKPKNRILRKKRVVGLATSPKTA